LDKNSTYRELDYFLAAGNNKLEVLKSKYLVDETFVNYWNQFWKVTPFVVEKAISCFLE